MSSGSKTGGRQKGTPNKISAQVRENVVHVFEQLGGVKKMADWALDNLTEFYKLYGRLLPTEATLNISRDVKDLSRDDILEQLAAIEAEEERIAAGGGADRSGPEKPSKLH